MSRGSIVGGDLFEQAFAAFWFLCEPTVTTCSLTCCTTQGRTSVEPSLFLVWLSNTGSCTLTATRPIMPSRTSWPAKFARRTR